MATGGGGGGGSGVTGDMGGIGAKEDDGMVESGEEREGKVREGESSRRCSSSPGAVACRLRRSVSESAGEGECGEEEEEEGGGWRREAEGEDSVSDPAGEATYHEAEAETRRAAAAAS